MRNQTIQKQCKDCGYPLIIDEWEGWRWYCYYCDKYHDYATPEEIKEEECLKK